MQRVVLVLFTVVLIATPFNVLATTIPRGWRMVTVEVRNEDVEGRLAENCRVNILRKTEGAWGTFIEYRMVYRIRTLDTERLKVVLLVKKEEVKELLEIRRIGLRIVPKKIIQPNSITVDELNASTSNSE